jgi:hypothetical protein
VCVCVPFSSLSRVASAVAASAFAHANSRCNQASKDDVQNNFKLSVISVLFI